MVSFGQNNESFVLMKSVTLSLLLFFSLWKMDAAVPVVVDDLIREIDITIFSADEPLKEIKREVREGLNDLLRKFPRDAILIVLMQAYKVCHKRNGMAPGTRRLLKKMLRDRRQSLVERKMQAIRQVEAQAFLYFLKAFEFACKNNYIWLKILLQDCVFEILHHDKHLKRCLQLDHNTADEFEALRYVEREILEIEQSVKDEVQELEEFAKQKK